MRVKLNCHMPPTAPSRALNFRVGNEVAPYGHHDRITLVVSVVQGQALRERAMKTRQPLSQLIRQLMAIGSEHSEHPIPELIAPPVEL